MKTILGHVVEGRRERAGRQFKARQVRSGFTYTGAVHEAIKAVGGLAYPPARPARRCWHCLRD